MIVLFCMFSSSTLAVMTVMCEYTGTYCKSYKQYAQSRARAACCTRSCSNSYPRVRCTQRMQRIVAAQDLWSWRHARDKTQGRTAKPCMDWFLLNDQQRRLYKINAVRSPENPGVSFSSVVFIVDNFNNVPVVGQPLIVFALLSFQSSPSELRLIHWQVCCWRSFYWFSDRQILQVVYIVRSSRFLRRTERLGRMSPGNWQADPRFQSPSRCWCCYLGRENFWRSRLLVFQTLSRWSLDVQTQVRAESTRFVACLLYVTLRPLFCTQRNTWLAEAARGGSGSRGWEWEPRPWSSRAPGQMVPNRVWLPVP